MKANSFVLAFFLFVLIAANAGLFAQNQTDKAVAQYYHYQSLLKQLLTEPPTSAYSDALYVYWQTVTKAESA
jgi:Mn2+/Fe2+ NRAMP family transporter